MTFGKFKKDLLSFLQASNVNLGRLHSKTRDKFLETVKEKFESFENNVPSEGVQDAKTGPINDRIICIKPTNSNKALDIGKGVHAMTPSESMRADEQLNRSPFGAKTKRPNDE